MERESLSFINSDFITKAQRKKIDSLKSDESIIEKFISVKSNYLITVFSQQQNEIQLFILEIKNWLFPYPKWIYETLVGKRIENSRELNFIQITDREQLENARNAYVNEVIIKDRCPACNNVVSARDKVCADCGLTLNII
ncbi:zinc ribbon domain-containing protein [uncultured Christiangramia sp.]|uniref:zinc ribbon domain-containing protein n=1 Tax=uncultured Christiangramia sp. TaxID=503836 RepID=UPI00261BC02C|nr:zinc ribbon domain-containing protein [uncultured Christiangramia sp.]